VTKSTRETKIIPGSISCTGCTKGHGLKHIIFLVMTPGTESQLMEIGDSDWAPFANFY